MAKRAIIFNEPCIQLLILFILFYVEGSLQVCLCTMFVSGAHGDQETASKPLELKFQVVVTCHRVCMCVLGIENTNVKYIFLAGWWWFMSLIPALRRQMDL